MCWTYGEALDGNVALMGELVAMEGVLALGLADSLAGARTLARSSLCEGFGAVRRCRSITWVRSEEHTSELQSLMRISYAVFCLKKKKAPQVAPQVHARASNRRIISNTH